MAFVAGEKQLALLASRQGESDLIYHDGTFYLAATCNVDNPDPSEVTEFLGVDFGVVEIASTSDGKNYSGAAIKGVRHRHRRLRTKLQKKQTRAAKRRLKKLSGKEARFGKHSNHCIAKEIVETARRTGRGIAIEELTGIRERIKARHGDQRAVLHSWAFAQLRAFLEYKAILAGVLLVVVDPRNSSRECSRCGHTEKSNRPSQSLFSCRQCGFTVNADFNAARIISSRATSKLAEHAA
jgi:IS605 OrfB family transposase